MFIWPYVGHIFQGRKIHVSIQVSCVTFMCSSLLLLSSRVFVGKTNTSTLFVAEVFASKANTSNLLVFVELVLVFVLVSVRVCVRVHIFLFNWCVCL